MEIPDEKFHELITGVVRFYCNLEDRKRTNVVRPRRRWNSVRLGGAITDAMVAVMIKGIQDDLLACIPELKVAVDASRKVVCNV